MKVAELRQTLRHKVTLVWTREEERRLHWQRMIEIEIPGKRKEEGRKEDKMDGFG